VTLSGNVGQHTIMLIVAQPGVETWRVVVLGMFGAIAPLGQIAGTHLAVTRLSRVAQQFRKVKPAQQEPSMASAIGRAVTRRVVGAIEAAGPPPVSPGAGAPAGSPTRGRTSGRGKAPARKRSGVKPVELMRAYWQEQVAAGRIPTEAELDRAAGVTYRLAKKYRPGWLAELENVRELPRAGGGHA
jgi:hypothetical protein